MFFLLPDGLTGLKMGFKFTPASRIRSANSWGKTDNDFFCQLLSSDQAISASLSVGGGAAIHNNPHAPGVGGICGLNEEAYQVQRTVAGFWTFSHVFPPFIFRIIFKQSHLEERSLKLGGHNMWMIFWILWSWCLWPIILTEFSSTCWVHPSPAASIRVYAIHSAKTWRKESLLIVWDLFHVALASRFWWFVVRG